MLRIETGLILLGVLVALLRPTLGVSFFSRIESFFAGIARRRALSIAIVGILPLIIRAALLPILPIPEPIVHDEFGYLLAADTFSHGRLTNPTPPLWPHFETFSVLMRPTYQCYGQPGQGMLLALGKVLFGHPFWGVWLSCGVMCASITWMLQAWVGAEWALLGGFLAMARYAVFGYWANSYWGGAIAAIGGALVLGALPRIRDSHHLRNALVMGVGLAILANTRPYEGVLFSLPVAAALFAWMFGKNRPAFSVSVRQVILPLTLILSIAAGGLGYYFWRVTGSSFKMPYEIERQTYAMTPYMLWQGVRSEPHYNNTIIQKMYEEDLNGFRHTPYGIDLAAKAVSTWCFFLGPLLSLPILLLAFSLPRGFSLRSLRPSTAFLLLEMSVFVVGLAVETYYSPHYAAPATCVVVAFCILAISQLRTWKATGLLLSRLIVLICLVSLAIRALAVPLRVPLGRNYEFAWFQNGAPSLGRAAIERELRKMPDQQLVLVRYSPDHRPFDEWVYNDADIEHEKVVWARELDSAHNQLLLQHFAGRHVWLLEPDSEKRAIVPYKPLVLTSEAGPQ